MRIRPIVVSTLFLAMTAPALVAQRAQVRLDRDPDGNELVLSIGPVHLPANHHGTHDGHGGVYPPVATVEIPFDGYLHSFRYEVVDPQGNALSTDYLHHLNLNDPDNRELFLPIARRIVAVSKETPPIDIPPDVMGYPVERGQQIVVSAMLHNPSDDDVDSVTVHVRIGFRLAIEGPPRFTVLPFHLDVAFPAGEKSFDLPEGRHSWSNEGRPAVAGTIMALGSHYHDWVEHIVLEDLTAGEILWVGCPVAGDERGEVDWSTLETFYEVYEAVPDIDISPEHTYRVTVTYDNRRGAMIPYGGMGVVAGLMVPAESATWPELDRDQPLYVIDRRHFMREVDGRWADIAGDLLGDPRYSAIAMDAEPSPAFRAMKQACPWSP